jgi:hypothetical protein
MFDPDQEIREFSYCLELACKYRSPDVTQWNPGLFIITGISRITLRFIRATVGQVTSI